MSIFQLRFLRVLENTGQDSELRHPPLRHWPPPGFLRIGEDLLLLMFHKEDAETQWVEEWQKIPAGQNGFHLDCIRSNSKPANRRIPHSL